MAGVDDVTPEVRIEGGDEVVAEFQKMAASAVDSFAKIAKAAAGMGDMGKHVKEGADTGKKALSELSTIGVEAFQKILEAALSGDFAPIIGQMFGKTAQAIAETTEQIIAFVEAQASVMETMSSLAEATGMTLSQIEGLQDAFASVGISTNGFERSIGRLAISIGNEWSQIQQAVRTSADSQTGAMLHMQETAFGVQKAYHSLNSAIDESARTATHSALSIQQASIGLRQAMNELSDFATKAQQNSLSVEGAALNLQRAQLALLKDQGYDVTAQEKALKLESDKVAVKEAQLRLQEAQTKKMREGLEMEELQLKVAKARQEAEDANAKAIENSIKAADRLKDAQLGIRKAQLAAREASEKQHELDLKDIPAIAKEIENVAAGYKTWDQVMNHAEISAQNLTKAVVLASAGGSGQPPQALDVFREMVKLFAQMGDSADASQKKIEMVQHTMGAGFRAGQASAAQIVAVINRFGKDAEGAQHAMDELFKSTEKFAAVKFGGFDLAGANKSLLEFNSAFARFEALLDQVKGRMAAIMSEPLTKLFNSMRESLESNDGALHRFVEGVAEVISIFAKLIEAFASSDALQAFGLLLMRTVSFAMDLIEAFAQLVGGFLRLIGFGEQAGKFFATLTQAINVLKLAFDGWRLAISAVLIGLGLLEAAAIKAKSMLPGQDAKSWEQAQKESPLLQSGNRMKDSALADSNRDVQALNEAGKKLVDGAASEKQASEAHQSASQQHKEAAERHAVAAGDTSGAAQQLNKAADTQSSAATGLSDAGAKLDAAGDKLAAAATSLAQAAAKSGGVGAAEGGHIRGPGTSTSDSIPARLSDNEFVIRSAAVEHYGVPLFDALNSLALGGGPARGFAMGGHVGSVRSAALPSGQAGPTSVLNLTIDGQHFNGLKAPEHVASKLKTYAVTRQSSSAGKTPSWNR